MAKACNRAVNLLLVEDDLDTIEALRGVLPHVSITVARSKAEAEEHLGLSTFDLIVCDLELPRESDSPGLSVEHGRAVLARIRDETPGVPVRVFSVHSAYEEVHDVWITDAQEDLFGENAKTRLVDFVEKRDLDALVKQIEHFAERIATLNDNIEIDYQGDEPLIAEHIRILRIYASRCEGVLARSSDFPPGLSGSRVMRVEVHRQGGGLASLVVGKLGSLTDAVDEATRYQTFFARTLGPKIYTPLADTVVAGAGNQGGVFYSLGEEYKRSLLSLLPNEDQAATQIVLDLKAATARWRDSVPPESMKVEELRRLLVSDDEFDALDGKLPLDRCRRAEEVSAGVRMSPQHGDLHGGNVLVNLPSLDCVLIDFGFALMAPATLDPLTLELSLGFLPSASPLREACQSLDIRGVVTGEAPTEARLAGFQNECRAWAREAAGGPRDIHAVTYAYAVRQFHHEGIDEELAAELAVTAADALIASAS